MRIFWLAFLGKTAGTLFVAICTAFAFGPPEWAGLLLGTEPTIYVRILFGVFALGTAATVFGPLGWALISKVRSRVTTGPLPIAVSKVEQKYFSNYAGFYKRPDFRDAQAISYGVVTIANTSTTKRVALDLKLRITSEDGINLSSDADLRGPFGMIFREQVISDAGIISEAKRAPVGEQ